MDKLRLYKYAFIACVFILLTLAGCGTVARNSGGGNNNGGVMSIPVENPPEENPSADENKDNAEQEENGDSGGSEEQNENDDDAKPGDDAENANPAGEEAGNDGEEDGGTEKSENELTLQSISASLKEEKIYYDGDTLTPEDIEVSGTYSDGHMEILADFEFFSLTLSSSANYYVAVSTANCVDGFYINVEPIALDRLEILSFPANTTNYIENYAGHGLNLSGLVVRGVYNNGSVSENFLDYSTSIENNSVFTKSGEHAVTICANNRTDIKTNFTVIVKPRKLTELSASLKKPEKVYYEGDALSAEDIAVTGVYDNDREEILTNFNFVPVALVASDNYYVTVSTANCAYVFNIKVNAIVLERIEIVGNPAQPEYWQDETLNTTLQIRKIYNDSRKDNNVDYGLSVKLDTPDENFRIDVNLDGKSACFAIKVKEIKLNSITVLNAKKYFLGDRIKKTDFTVTGIYNNGDRSEQTYTISQDENAELTQLGTRVITVTVNNKYGEKSANINIEINIPADGFAFVVNSDKDGQFYVPTSGGTNYKWKIYSGNGAVKNAEKTSVGIDYNGILLDGYALNTDYTIVIVPIVPISEENWLESFGFGITNTGAEHPSNKYYKLKRILTMFPENSKNDFDYTFYNCKDLTEAPSDLFGKVTVTSHKNTFTGTPLAEKYTF
ncbi:MAG: bacterial Ig-like domain-containing protein [Candidatus Margulisbacteria bacterium]|jgi:hypothetical protein|nr:bacterial Ig-like domain-containing protein [Candidatus Margulisiibacteriota bacterium]